MRIATPRTRTVVALLAVFAPGAVRRFLWRRLLGYDIHPTASIGRSLIDVDAFRAGPGVRVSGLSVIRGLDRVELEEQADIGPLVWINAIRTSSDKFAEHHDRDAALILRRSAAITSMHFVDCCDRVELGEYSVLGGMQSQLLSHAFDFRAGELTVGPIVIGAYTVISTRVVILPGTDIGAKCIIAAGSVLPSGKYEQHSLHAGVPAVHKADLDPNARMFTRTANKIR